MPTTCWPAGPLSDGGHVTETAELEHLADAPIDEVACGVMFDPVATLDPIVVGSYWRERVLEYPSHELRTPLRDAARILDLVNVVPPLRAMLVSHDDQYVLQIQPDRFYFNWRRRDRGYPRFNTHGGSEGVLSRALREFQRFSAFCASTLGAAPKVRAIELAKVDIIREKVYWRALSDVAEILPCLRDFIDFTKSDSPSFGLRFSEPRGQGHVQINIALGARPAENNVRALTVETRLQCEAGVSSMESAFKQANADLNAVFAGLIPAGTRTKYFNQARQK